jgi:predicted nucleotidyltransferase
MVRHRPDIHAPRPSVADPRPVLLAAALDFVRDVRSYPHVLRIALVGSLSTDKPIPKDVDLLVTLVEHTDLTSLARAARRLKGRAGAVNLGADLVLCDRDGRYLGRVCGFRE